MLFTFLSPFSFSQLNPASPFYFLKSASEIFQLKLAKTTGEKAEMELKFADARVKEVKDLSLIHQELIQPTLERYWSLMGEVIGLLDLKNEDKMSQVHSMISSETNLLIGLYPKVEDAEAKRSLKTTVFRLSGWDNEFALRLESVKNFSLARTVLSSKIDACKFLVREASNSALNEVEKSVFKSRGEKCLSI